MTGDETRAALIDAAERHFAAHGFDGASLRAIMREAGANPAAVHYHFGGKDGLLAAVLDRVVLPISDRRREGLEDLRAHDPDGPLPVRELVERFLRPDFEAITELRTRGPGRAAVIGHAYGQPTDHVRRLMTHQFAPVAAEYLAELARALPDIDPAVLDWRLRWFVVGMIVALFSNADLADGPIDPADPGSALRRAVDVVTAGLEAPTT